MTATSLTIGELAAVAFAAYGTLFDVAATVGRARDRLGGQARELARLWRAHQERLLASPAPLADYWHITGRALDAAMADLGIKDAPLRARLMQLLLNVDAFPDARAAVEGLRTLGLRVAVLSNATLTMLISALKHTGLDGSVDQVVPAAAGAYKPAADGYVLACERLHAEPAKVLYVTADPVDAEAAAAAGLKPVWLRRDASANVAPPSAITTVSSLAELRPLLSAIS
ncbi:MAG TPA: haloacid dehalogenase type II [Alphaproteobacteria bacterium]|jgi:2-haloacid dehalogenase|nr:haloacid dehalogenase type II [Alphaproteobacteria bacterium]